MCPHERPDWRMCPHCNGINDLQRPAALPVPMGWQCPACRACFSPFTSMCLNCRPTAQMVTTAGTSIAQAADDEPICSYCGAPKNSSTCQQNHP